MARPKAGDDTGRLRLLEAATQHLLHTPESALRAKRIADDAKVAITLIAHHFGSREQLIIEAQQARFAAQAKRDLARIKRLFAKADTKEAFHDALVTIITKRLRDATRDPADAARLLALFGAAHGRNGMKDAYSAAYTPIVTALTMVLLDAQQRGIVPNHVDVRTAATVIAATLYGLCFTVFDTDAPDDTRVSVAVAAMLHGVLHYDDEAASGMSNGRK